MEFKQVENVILSFRDITKEEKEYGDDFHYRKDKPNHRIIAERVKQGIKVKVRGYLLVKNLPDYQGLHSKNGHIRLSTIKDENILKELISRIISTL